MGRYRKRSVWPKPRYDRCGERIPSIFDLPIIIFGILLFWFGFFDFVFFCFLRFLFWVLS